MEERIEGTLLIVAGAGIDENDMTRRSDEPSVNAEYQLLPIILQIAGVEALHPDLKFSRMRCWKEKAWVDVP